jgi:hypothetical protein
MVWKVWPIPRNARRELASLLLAFVASALAWWMLAYGPLRDSNLARGDVIDDLVVRLGTDERGAAGPPIYFIAYDRESWRSAGMPGETPADAIATMLDFARQSGARLALLDLDLSTRAAEWAPVPSLEGPIARALSEWESDPVSPPLFLTAFGRSGHEGGPAYRNLVRDFRKIAFASTALNLDSDNVVRSVAAWSCDAAQGVQMPSALLYVAAMRDRPRASAIPSTVPRTVQSACAAGRPTVEIGGRTVRQTERILYHVSGRRTVAADHGGLVFDRIEYRDLTEALSQPPQVRCADARRSFFEASCGAIIVIGADHDGTPDRFGTPVAAAPSDQQGPAESVDDPRLPGAVILANALRGYLVFGPAEELGAARGLAIVLLSVLAIYIIFYLVQRPQQRLRRWRKSRRRWKAMAGRLDWLFGPIVAKFLATGLWSDILVLLFSTAFGIMSGPGMIVASYVSAIVFTIREVQGLMR